MQDAMHVHAASLQIDHICMHVRVAGNAKGLARGGSIMAGGGAAGEWAHVGVQVLVGDDPWLPVATHRASPGWLHLRARRASRLGT